MKKFTCIACPVGCTLTVEQKEDELIVTGNQCKRGKVFGENEYLHPMRMLTTTVKSVNGNITRIPVISNGEVPKDQLQKLVQELYKIEVKCPIKRGDIIMKNIKNTGVDIIATRTVL